MARNPVAAYQSDRMKTLSPGERVVMVYDGIIKNLEEGARRMPSKLPQDIEATHNALQLAERLITELRLALDKQRGGELAEVLDNLYDFWSRSISEANVKKTPRPIEDVLTMARELRESWQKATIEARKQQMGG